VGRHPARSVGVLANRGRYWNRERVPHAIEQACRGRIR
jgi:hypothetical protein